MSISNILCSVRQNRTCRGLKALSVVRKTKMSRGIVDNFYTHKPDLHANFVGRFFDTFPKETWAKYPLKAPSSPDFQNL